MRRSNKYSLTVMGVVLGLLLVTGSVLADGGGGWPSAGNDLQNTRYQNKENKISPSNVGTLAQKWTFTTDGDVSATPAVDGTTVYVPDWAGNLYRHRQEDRPTGLEGQDRRMSPACRRQSPGDTRPGRRQGDHRHPGLDAWPPAGGPGGWVLAFNKNTGALLWKTQADTHPAAIITQSATVFGNRVYVGVASLEEALAAFVPGYQLSFRGSMLALDLNTGAIVWKTYTAPDGYTGNAVWGSSPAIDTKRGQVYIATGNNYSVPQSVLDCVTAAGSDPAAQAACLPADDYFDSIMALDLKTGAVRWATRAIPYDAWTVDCIPFYGDGSNCPDPAGPDYDFGQAPALFTVKTAVRASLVTWWAQGRRAASTGRSTPTPARWCGSPRPAPAARAAACSGARPSTASASTRPTPTATSSLGRRPQTEPPPGSGAPWTPRPARCSGRPGRRTAAAPPARSPRPTAWCSAARSTPRATCTPSTRRPATCCGASPAAARACRVQPSPTGWSSGARATATSASARRTTRSMPSRCPGNEIGLPGRPGLARNVLRAREFDQ